MVEVTNRTFQKRYLLLPTRKLRLHGGRSCRPRWSSSPRGVDSESLSAYSRKIPSSADTGNLGFAGKSPPARESDVVRRALDEVRSTLPGRWTLGVEEEARKGQVAFDALVTLESPDGAQAVLAVEAKRTLATREIANVLEQLRRLIDRASDASLLPMVVARYLSPPTRERLEQKGVAYADATGNVRIEIDRPAFFLRSTGEDRDPWRGPGRPRNTLKGAAAARVVRALVDFVPPYTVPELVKRSGASTGATYRVVKLLEEEELLERKPRGPIERVLWRRLIERWSEDDGFMRSEVVQRFLFPRGVERVPEALRAAGELRYVLTGSLAARSFAPHAPPRVAMIHVDDPAEAAETLGLRPVDRGTNVLLAAQRGNVPFLRARTVDGVVTAAPSQIAVDLLTGPGRSPSEGQAVLDWMESHEPEWRL